VLYNKLHFQGLLDRLAFYTLYLHLMSVLSVAGYASWYATVIFYIQYSIAILYYVQRLERFMSQTMNIPVGLICATSV